MLAPRWRVVVALFTVTSGIATAGSTFGVFLPLLSEAFGWSRGAGSVARSISLLLRGGAAFPAGPVADRGGPARGARHDGGHRRRWLRAQRAHRGAVAALPLLRRARRRRDVVDLRADGGHGGALVRGATRARAGHRAERLQSRLAHRRAARRVVDRPVGMAHRLRDARPARRRRGRAREPLPALSPLRGAPPPGGGPPRRRPPAGPRPRPPPALPPPPGAFS